MKRFSWKHFFASKKEKQFSLLSFLESNSKCFQNKHFLRAQMEKHLGDNVSQFCNNVSSFARGLINTDNAYLFIVSLTRGSILEVLIQLGDISNNTQSIWDGILYHVTCIKNQRNTKMLFSQTKNLSKGINNKQRIASGHGFINYKDSFYTDILRSIETETENHQVTKGKRHKLQRQNNG